MHKARKWLVWFGINVPLYALLIAGIMGSAGAWAVVMFFLGVYGSIVLFGTLNHVKVPENGVIPRWLDIGYDALFTLTLVWTLHWGLAILYLVTMCLQHEMITRD